MALLLLINYCNALISRCQNGLVSSKTERRGAAVVGKRLCYRAPPLLSSIFIEHLRIRTFYITAEVNRFPRNFSRYEKYNPL